MKYKAEILCFFLLTGYYCSRNPVLNKSFDVLPQIKDDDDTPSVNSVSEIISIK